MPRSTRLTVTDRDDTGRFVRVGKHHFPTLRVALIDVSYRPRHLKES